jgi:hypothetical protein
MHSIVSNDALTIHIRYVMGLKNTVAFLVEREKPWWRATKDRSLYLPDSGVRAASLEARAASVAAERSRLCLRDNAPCFAFSPE